jgi:hypothetical protein
VLVIANSVPVTELHGNAQAEMRARATKLTFSAAIVQMLGSALWIVIGGGLIVVFIPELPLRSGAGGPTRVEV